ncbi:MAG: putative peroxiredoxin bcp [Deltaproteobacteria bacterium ADurb.Bin510]|nr:MAG: putative peroxiredoxin bcp [Deltaproteobacteria bacterium ADurb.Bin510]
MLKLGDLAPDFSLSSADGFKRSLADYRGGYLVLYFYPRDNTGGCTTEAIDFTAALPEFAALGARVVGISPDTVERHQSFRAKHGLAVELLADPEHAVIERYGAWQAKTLYGKTSLGVMRSTYLVDPEGVIVRVWPRVKVAGHAAEVLDELRARRG